MLNNIIKKVKILEEKIINEDYSDLLLNISKIKDYLGQIKQLDIKSSEELRKIFKENPDPVDHEEREFDMKELFYKFSKKLGCNELANIFKEEQ